MLEKIKKFKWGYIALFLLLASVGACFIIFTETLKTLAIVIGVILALFGIIYGTLNIADKKRDVGFAIKSIIAICAIIGGVVTAICQETAMEVISSLFGLFLIVDGSFKLHTAAMSKRFKLISWWFMLIPSVIVIIGGFLAVEYGSLSTETAQKLLSYLLGATLIIDSIGNLISAFYVTGFEKNQKKEIIAELEAEKAVNTKPAEDADISEEAENDAENDSKNNVEVIIEADSSDGVEVEIEGQDEIVVVEEDAVIVVAEPTDDTPIIASEEAKATEETDT